jgi:regulator of sigma E protease
MGYLIMLFLISLLVILHEVGHMLVAQRCGVKVERFGLGLPFGPTLWQKEWKGITWCLHAVPLGGYVSFPDDNAESDVPAHSPQRFENQPLLNQAAIAMAGITVNAIIAVVLMVFVHAKWGVQASQLVVTGYNPVVIEQHTPNDVKSLGELALVQRPFTNTALEPVSGPGEGVTVAYFTSLENSVRFRGLHLGTIPQRFDITPAENPEQPLVTVLSSPAAAAGIELADVLFSYGTPGGHTTLNGYYSEPMQRLQAALKRTAPGEPVHVETAPLPDPSGEHLAPKAVDLSTFALNPSRKLGIYMGVAQENRHVDFLENARISWGVLSDMVVQNFIGLGQLITGQLSPEMLDGPVGVVKQGGRIIEESGIQKGLFLTAIISIILAVMNLLPFPPLDGSYLVYIGYEALFRKPFPGKFKQVLNMSGFFLLMGLMLFVLGNDIVKLFR